MNATLRARLIGTWRLVSYEARQPGSATIFPMGTELDGRITYTADGNVSVHIAARARPDLASGDIGEATTEEWASAARCYFGYCGTFDVDEEQRSVTHLVAVSFVPNWTGRRQVRYADLTGDRLELSSSPMPIAGTARTAHLLWRHQPSQAFGEPGGDPAQTRTAP